MIIVNITNSRQCKDKDIKPTNLTLQCLKLKQEDKEDNLAPGAHIDTSMHNVTDEKISKSFEIIMWQKQGLIKCYSDMEKAIAGMRTVFAEEVKAQKNRLASSSIDSNKANISAEEQLLEIKSTSNLSYLEDLIEDDKQPEVVVLAAMRRMNVLDGEGIDNPELKNQQALIQ